MIIKRPYRVTLVMSIVLTTGLFIHEYIYDIPNPPYTLIQDITEFLTIGTAFTLAFWVFFSGLYFLTSKIDNIIGRFPGPLKK